MTQLPDHHLDVGSGWSILLDELHAEIIALVPDYEVFQVKEKFGALRIYLEDGLGVHTDAIQAFLNAVEALSMKVCEVCGKPGTPGGQSWIKTLCPDHRKVDEAERKTRWAR